MKQVLENYGIPSEIKTDRRSVFTYNQLSDKTPEKDSMTQFAYAMSKLGANLTCDSDLGYKPKCERLVEWNASKSTNLFF